MPHDLISTSINDEQKADVCSILAVGCDRHTAANYVGCTLADIRHAMRADTRFAEKLKRAEASVELKHMSNIHGACKDVKNWRTSVWWLEQRAPERFARRAGVVTAMQLKTFVAILVDIIAAGDSPLDLSQTVARLKSFADSIDLLLQNERASDADSFDSLSMKLCPQSLDLSWQTGSINDVDEEDAE